MRIVIFTSNALRHKYIANVLSENADEALVISECQPHDSGSQGSLNSESSLEREHFRTFKETEKKFFGTHKTFTAPTFPVVYKEVNSPNVYEAMESFKPDAAFVYGSWIIKEPLLSLIPKGRFVNLHLGLSPYYRGSGTNFWPLVNGEPEYVGATILHIDAGIDTGDIIAHVRPEIASDDTVHTIGCKTIIEGGKTLLEVLKKLKRGEALPRVAQWEVPQARVYKKKDCNEEAIKKYLANLRAGMMEKYARRSPKEIKLVSL